VWTLVILFRRFCLWGQFFCAAPTAGINPVSCGWREFIGRYPAGRDRGIKISPQLFISLCVELFHIYIRESTDRLAMPTFWRTFHHAMPTFWRTFHHDGKFSPAWWGGGGRGGARSPPFTLSTVTSKLVMCAPAEGSYTPPISPLPFSPLWVILSSVCSIFCTKWIE
jgi:hypothetical protein